MAPYAGTTGYNSPWDKYSSKDTDFLFPYYRDMLTVLSAGMTAEEIILNGISKATDLTSGGRHMSNHFSKMEWHIENVSSATATHDLHAAGVARAMVYYGQKGVAITSHGESAASEAMCMRQSMAPAMSDCRLSLSSKTMDMVSLSPKKDQTANRKVADNFSGFKNLRIIHCNGKDVFDSMNAMTEAKEYAIANRTPVIVQANCVRIAPTQTPINIPCIVMRTSLPM